MYRKSALNLHQLILNGDNLKHEGVSLAVPLLSILAKDLKRGGILSVSSLTIALKEIIQKFIWWNKAAFYHC